jgi:putative FmdB family regulatory protein
MPTYDYRCQACDHEFEKFQPITASPIRKCPVCGERKVKRLIGTGAGILFKGSGFYQTDYRSDSYREAAESDNPVKSDATGRDKPAGAKGSSKSKPKADNKSNET